MAQHESTRLAGAVASGIRDALGELLGEAGVKAVLDALPPSARDEYREFLPLSKVRIETIELAVHAGADYLHRPAIWVNTHVNRVATERTMRGVWGFVARLTTDAMVLSRAPSLYAQTYDRGKLEMRIVAPGHAELQIRGRPGMSELARDGFAVGLETTLRVTGRRGAEVRGSAHRDGADYVAKWSSSSLFP